MTQGAPVVPAAAHPARMQPAAALVDRIRAGIIGDGEVLEGVIRQQVLPRHANTHTESSGTGLATSRLREDARQINELPWRETIADVVVIGTDADGHIDLAGLSAQLARYAERPPRIGSLSAPSHVTGILSGPDAIAALLHAHGALSFWITPQPARTSPSGPASRLPAP